MASGFPRVRSARPEWAERTVAALYFLFLFIPGMTFHVVVVFVLPVVVLLLFVAFLLNGLAHLL